MTGEELISEAGRRLGQAAPDAQIVLFGSYARGDAGPESDLDFLVIESNVDSRHQEAVRLRRTLRGLDVPADVIVVTAQQVDEWRDVHGTLIHEALQEGRVVVGT